MYKIEDLFDKRSVVGAKLSKVLVEYNITKAELYKHTGVSRPTIDKLLAGSITSKKNFENHITKILSYIGISSDQLLGNVAVVNNQTRIIRNLMKISMKEISERTGISIERLEEIENGENATLTELRDIAFCTSISVNDLMGKNFFDTQVSKLDDFINIDKSDEINAFSGFWGHVGILMSNTCEYLWYPITGKTREYIYKMIENKRLVIPCMNNKVLYLYMPNIKELILLDEASDQPARVNWNNNVSCGEIPLVIFEALEDYMFFDEDDTDNISEKLKKAIDEIIKENKWSDEDIEEMIHVSKIYYEDGKKRCTNVEFDDSDSIINEIIESYSYENSETFQNIICFNDTDGSEVFINLNQISMLEFPMLKVEEAIIKVWDEILYEE